MKNHESLSSRARIRSVIAAITNLAAGDPNEQTQAAAELDALPRGYFDDLGIPKKALGAIKDALPSVVRKTQQPGVLAWIAIFLAESRSVTSEVLELFVPLLGSEDENLIIAILFLVGSGRKLSEPYLPRILIHARHGNVEVRWRVAWAYHEISPARRTLKLFQGLGHRSSQYRSPLRLH